jgi:hypothetical protein
VTNVKNCDCALAAFVDNNEEHEEHEVVKDGWSEAQPIKQLLAKTRMCSLIEYQ